MAHNYPVPMHLHKKEKRKIESTYEEMTSLLGQLRDRLHHLEEIDYMTAYYKGYSSNGATFDEVKDEISALQEQIEQLKEEMTNYDWPYR